MGNVQNGIRRLLKSQQRFRKRPPSPGGEFINKQRFLQRFILELFCVFPIIAGDRSTFSSPPSRCFTFPEIKSLISIALQRWSCCHSKLINKSKANMACCYNQWYDSTTHKCCGEKDRSGVVQSLSAQCVVWIVMITLCKILQLEILPCDRMKL